jgi:hypothetical protein
MLAPPSPEPVNTALTVRVTTAASVTHRIRLEIDHRGTVVATIIHPSTTRSGCTDAARGVAGEFGRRSW